VARHLPGQDQHHRRREEQGVSAGRAGHHEVPVHKPAEERGDARERADNQRNTDQEFTRHH